MANTSDYNEIASLTADIVSAYVSANTIVAADLPGLIETVSAALHEAEQKSGQPLAVELTPAVPIKKSVTPDHIICLEDGKRFKSLKRHLNTHFNLTPEQYMEKWGLPYDYPMVAPNYAASRSALAKKMGLGRKKRT